jgi:FkbM family methyltransferase
MNLLRDPAIAVLKLWQQAGVAPGWYYQTVERWGPGLHSGRPVAVRLRNGCRMSCDLRDHVSRQIYFHGLYEPIESYLFVHLLKPGDTVIDAGANVGQYTLLASTRIGPRGSVHSFEPVPATFALLSGHVTSNGLRNVRTNCLALWDRVETVRLGLDGNATGNSGSFSIGSAGGEAAVTATATTLDEYAAQASLPKIDAIKMDIEGAELFALRGMRSVLGRDHPYLLVELNRKASESLECDTTDTWHFLRDLGYRAWAIGLSSEASGPVGRPPTAAQQNLLFHTRDLPEAVCHGWTLKSILRWARCRAEEP